MDFIDYDDFYNEPSESDIAIEELKEHLRNEVKSEILNKLERLEKENKELQEVRKKWLNIKRELESKIASVELEKEAILRNARREIYDATLQDLFDNCTLFSKIYEVDKRNYIDKPKCSKCNDERKYQIITPDGVEHTVDCSCQSSYSLFELAEDKNIKVYVQKGKREDNFSFRISKDETYTYGYEISKKDIYEKAEDVPANKTYKIYFSTKEEANRFIEMRNKEILKELGWDNE